MDDELLVYLDTLDHRPAHRRWSTPGAGRECRSEARAVGEGVPQQRPQGVGGTRDGRPSSVPDAGTGPSAREPTGGALRAP